MSTRVVGIKQVLLLAAGTTSTSSGLVMWRAVEEARRLFDGGGTDAEMVLPVGQCDTVSVKSAVETKVLAIRRIAGIPDGVLYEPDPVRAADLVQAVTRGVPVTHSGWDHRLLAANLQSLPGLRSDRALVVVTDLLIEPPSHRRYAIWQPVVGGAVLSAATLDPAYWPSRVAPDEVDRLATLKRRVRAADASVLGALLGLYRCATPGCFLCGDPESVSRLDDMDWLCTEHDVPDLAGRAFAPEQNPSHPALVSRRARL